MGIVLYFRCALGNHDVLTHLQTNWDDFYWLTGEFPPTFHILLMEIHGLQVRRRGRHNILSIENQVIQGLKTFYFSKNRTI